MLRRFAFLLALLAMFRVAGQTPREYATGLVLEDDRYDALPRQAAESGAKADLPGAVDLTPYCPEVRHQGYIFSCVGWAVGYAALSIQRAVLNQCIDPAVITRNAHSALFLYNRVKASDCADGARISDALRFLATEGDCLASQFDFDVNDCEQRPDSAVAAAARRYAIEDYLALFGTGEQPEIKIRRIKMVLARQKPVIAGLLITRGFYELKNAVYWHPALGNTAPAGGHALVVVGYDDRRQAFRLMNSWGKTWGDNGFIWVKYDDFAAFCKYAYTLYLLPAAPIQTPEAAERPLVQLSGHLEFRALTGWQSQSAQPVFEPAAAVWTGDRYRLRRDTWTVGQLFQLLAGTRTDDLYLYAFSIDARRNVHVHWPRQAALNEKFARQNESALLAAGATDVVLPGPSKALALAHAGADRLFVLFSKRKIDTVKKLADTLARLDGDPVGQLRRTLGQYAVPTTDISYAPDRIAFSASTRAAGYIVPVVLEVHGR